MYFITVMVNMCRNEPYEYRLVGYYKDFETAEKAVLNNECDLAEQVYAYAMIQKVGEGLYQEPDFVNLYMFDWENKEYFRVVCQDWRPPLVIG